MKISTRGRYALRLMIDLANHYGGGYVSLKDISERQQLSIKYLEQIVTILSRAGLIKSVRGALGGYMLVKEAEKYTAGDILRATEGSLAPVACLEVGADDCPQRSTCPTIKLWEGLFEAVTSYVDSVTLKTLADNAPAAEEYYI